MKFCTNCGKQADENVRFCPDCGTALDAELLAERDQAQLQEEKKCLDMFYRFIKYERLSWKIHGIYYLVCSAIILFCGILVTVLSATLEDSMLISMGITYIYLGVLFVPFAIIGFSMVKRCSNYMNTLYSDAKPMIKRCNAVGMIVLGAIFNTVGMAFIIVNFVRAKTDAKLLERIVARQASYSRDSTQA